MQATLFPANLLIFYAQKPEIFAKTLRYHVTTWNSQRGNRHLEKKRLCKSEKGRIRNAVQVLTISSYNKIDTTFITISLSGLYTNFNKRVKVQDL